MSRIGAVGQISVSSLSIIHQLAQISSDIDESTLRLSTLKRINSSKDDPAGLVHAQQLNSSLNAIQGAMSGVVRAQGFLNTADTAANSIITQLEAARSLALQAAGGTLNTSAVAGNQTDLNAILDSIDTLSQTDYNGTRLLDGTSGFHVTGINSSQIKDVEVQSKAVTGNATVAINVTTTALQATKSYAGGTLSAAATVEITGPDGTTSINLANGATTQDITDAFNSVTYLTGITATRVDATTVNFKTADYGSAATININPTSGSFTTTGTGVGRDAVATINGTSVTADGTTFNYASGNVVARIETDPSASGALSSFTVSGNGLEFRISADANTVSRIGLPDLSTSSLGGATGKLYTLRSGQGNSLTEGQAQTAVQIIDEALSEARLAEARMGGFNKYVLDTASSVLNTQQEQLTLAYKDVMDTDVAEETARLSRNQLLKDSATQALQVSLLDNSSVLDLLRSTVIRL